MPPAPIADLWWVVGRFEIGTRTEYQGREGAGVARARSRGMKAGVASL
ncbi:MAG: hypothetical protein FD125_1440 [bacterium]|nr:MAG: hypothetical protein FD125_1440 [bacterium]